jgi:hypothetical protein
MRSKAKIVFLIVGSLILFFYVLFAIGVLSTPRDFSSPQAVIRLLDENGTPLAGIEVGRNWYDSDIGKDGNDQVMTDRAGIARFPKVPASVGLFTGAWRKAYMSLGMCGGSSGASTTIYVRYHGLCTVVPKDKPLRKKGQSSYQDADGIWFYASTDNHSNTMAHLDFPDQTKNIDYVLSSSLRGE